MQSNFELLRRIDEKDYITEREHREFINELKKALEELETLKNAFKILIEHNLAVKQIRKDAKQISMWAFYEGGTIESKQEFKTVEKALELFKEAPAMPSKKINEFLGELKQTATKEIIELIKAKKANAEAHYKNQKELREKLYILGELDAYQDLLICIEEKDWVLRRVNNGDENKNS